MNSDGNKIKILNIITGGLKRDGITLSQLDYMKRMDKNKFLIDIAAVHNNLPDVIDEFKNAGCNVIVFSDRRKNLLKYIRKLNKVMKKNKYNIVHVHGSSSIMSIELLTAKHNHIPVRIAHSRNTGTDNPSVHKLLFPFFKNSYNVALACGNDAGKWLFKSKKFTVLHNGKDLNKYKFDRELRERQRKKYLLEGCKALGTVGNCNDQKNQFFLIDIFASAYKNDNTLRLFIIGEGPNKEDLKKKVADLSLTDKIFFLGRINNVNELLNAMDIMLLPSLYEGLPNVVLEWQANGLTCLVSDKVTTECKTSDLVNFISIDNGVEPWVDEIMNTSICVNSIRSKNSQVGCEGLIKNNFEIENNVKLLEKIYIEEYSKER